MRDNMVIYLVTNVDGWFLTRHMITGKYTYAPNLYATAFFTEPPRELAKKHNGFIVEYELTLKQILTKV